jgi:nucleoside phosphorylase
MTFVEVVLLTIAISVPMSAMTTALVLLLQQFYEGR